MTNQYSAALNIYLQAGAVCSDFFTKVVPPDVYTDQVNHSADFIFFFINLKTKVVSKLKELQNTLLFMFYNIHSLISFTAVLNPVLQVLLSSRVFWPTG